MFGRRHEDDVIEGGDALVLVEPHMLIDWAGSLGEHLEDQARRFGDHVLHVEWRTQNAKLRPTELAWVDADGDVGAEGTAACACRPELRRQMSVGIPVRDVVTDSDTRHRLRDRSE